MQIKIVVAGPAGCGKTTISNFLAGTKDSLTADKYFPTAGVRILEIESRIDGVREAVNIELWDSSGDSSFEGCWRAVMSDADGVILMYNPDSPAQDQQIVEWFEYFVKKNGLTDEQCMMFAHRGNPSNTTDRFRPPPLFSRVSAALTTVQSGPDVKNMFENFVRELCSMKQRK